MPRAYFREILSAHRHFSGAQSRCLSRSRLTLDRDRKSTRLNSSHLVISYAVFCLKKKKNDSVICKCTAMLVRSGGHGSVVGAALMSAVAGLAATAPRMILEASSVALWLT